MKGLALFLLVLGACAIVILPAYLLDPFAPETQRGLTAAYTAKRYAPVVTILFVAAGVWLATKLWNRWWRKTLVVLSILLLVATVWLSRQNHFEWMFRPLSNSAYASIDEAGFVEADDMVLAVKVNGEAAAYPVRLLAYHHVVHDVVGGVPIVVTY
jgi:small-conductance mechanosensitive channel